MKLDPRFRFDSFIIGSSNRLAVAAAKAVADAPGVLYNPLFLYGSSGLGKTHLLHAIGHAARERQPSLHVEYVALDEYMEEFHASLSAGRLDDFKKRYESAGIFMLDDVQFLTGRAEVQGELLRLFNVLQSRGTQVVLTSDRPSDEIADVSDRLLTRLAGGLTVDIGVPDFETRLAIVQRLASERAAVFRDGVMEELARVEFGNVRELQGGLNRLVAMQGLGDTPITEGDVRRLVGSRQTPHSTSTVGAVPPRAQEFDTFAQEVAATVVEHVEEWRVKLADAAARWRGEGLQVAVLDRALQLREPPDVDGLLQTFAHAVEYLRDLERQGVAADASLAGHPAFRDPEKVKDAHAMVQQAVASIEPPPRPEAMLTFASFVADDANQLALRAAQQVVQSPGREYSPLVLTGAGGSGRTHLLHAIGNALTAAGVHNVACVSADIFAEQLVSALREGTVERWRARYRNAGALLLDDAESVAGKERTQDELFHLLNAMQAAGRQVVLTSKGSLRAVSGLQERLRTRFGQGLSVELTAPTDVLRRALYAHVLAELNPAPSVLDMLAARAARSAGDVVATARRLHAAAILAGSPITPAFVVTELDGAVTRRVATHVMGDPERFVHRWPDLSARLIEEID
jgi:chromosomal replication initiator protein